jgi:hypothetical protein
MWKGKRKREKKKSPRQARKIKLYDSMTHWGKNRSFSWRATGGWRVYSQS